MRTAVSRPAVIVAAAALLGGITVVAGLDAGVVSARTPSARGPALFVSPKATSSGADTSCATARYITIQSAVNAARSGGTVRVCKGTYAEDVLVQRKLTLAGQNATIDAAGKANGIIDTASGTRVSGFAVIGARGEGIGVLPADALMRHKPPFAPVKDVSITRNRIIADDTGYVVPAGCAPPLYPGDCGGGLLLDAVANSTISANVILRNVDGILLVDDYGPSYRNVIMGNDVNDNVNECGITLPSHNPGAATVVRRPNGTYKITGLNPKVGGVFDNKVIGNVADDNGTGGFKLNAAGSGSGVLLASAGPGTAVYGNVIENNHLAGNGLAGVTLHAHYPGGEYLNGNQIVDNVVGTNNTKGDPLDSPVTTADFDTTGILLFSSEPIHTVVSGNMIRDDQIGIWATPNVTMTGSSPNRFTTSVSKQEFIEDRPYGTATTAVDVKSTSATLVGLAVANGARTTAYFNWGTSLPSFNDTVPSSIGHGTRPVGVSASISRLTPATTYHFQLVTTNTNGTGGGVTVTFTTAAAS